MRVAVVSDIHSNLHALEAALSAIDQDAPDELWCLGDLVGYGPRPNECCAAIAERADVCLAGNHDLAVRGTIDLTEFGGEAAVAAGWTRGVLEPQAQALLDRLEPEGEAHGVALYHGSARDPIWEYVLSDEAALATLELSGSPLVLVGHSHVALRVVQSGGEVEGGIAAAGAEVEVGGARALLNPGSVGQPRDGDAAASFAMFDTGTKEITYCRVPYDVATAANRIRENGLPPWLADRLLQGR